MTSIVVTKKRLCLAMVDQKFGNLARKSVVSMKNQHISPVFEWITE